MVFVFVIGWAWGAGYEPTNGRVRHQLLELLEERFKPLDRFVFYDIGSGFGGVLMDVAERFPNAFCTGIESDWFKCGVGNRRARKRGFGARVIVIRGNLLKLYFSDADVVYLFLSPLILKKKEFKERLVMLKPGCLVISYSHQIPMIEPAAVIGKNLFIYARNSS
ncbi:MAG: class I SAM-dependent methyltransferase [Thaumarchaeota archaeon]|nr:class I SAM-dependent methyltransferase [Nitrososphaerota archaeon]